MQWGSWRKSQNIEDRRGTPARGMGGAGRVGGLGLGGLLVLLALGYFLTGDPTSLLQTDGTAPIDPGPAAPRGTPGDPDSQMVSAVLGNTEDVWNQLFARANRQYPPPTLVLFTDAVDSACGMNSAAVGPFYCPADRKVYIDLAFYRELEQRFGAPGDFAQAYVIAHEVGHHVQNVLGIFEMTAQQRARGGNPNDLSIRQELQADCFAGVWGHFAAARGGLDAGDVEEGLNAAAAIGDDRIQRRSRGQVTPETWTHGSSDQRVRWFRTGLESGDTNACDTFGGR
jgi:predicted metalloprotease